MIRTYRDLGREAGRVPQHMRIVVRANHPVSPRPLPGERPPLSGSLDQIRDDVERLSDLGVGHLFFDLASHPAGERLSLLAALRRVVS